MNVRALLFGLYSMFFVMSNHAFIYEVKVLKKKNQSNNAYQYFIGCSDFHDKIHAANGQQLKKIEQMLGSCNKQSTKVLVEDLSSPNNNGCSSCGRFFINSRGGVLGGLAATCGSMGLDFSNLEFRYCRVTTLGPVLNNLKANMQDLAPVATIGISMLQNEVLTNIKEIQAYNDGSQLNKLYGQLIAGIIKKMKTLHLDKADDLTVAQFLAKHTDQKQRLDFIKQLLTFDSELLDMKMVHAIVHSPNKAKIVAIAGGSHIAKTAEMLEKIGYEKVSTTSIAYAKEHDLRQCLGSNIIEGAFCVKPQPINIDFIESLLKAD